MNKKVLLEKLVRLRKRIEVWADINGFGNLENQSEYKDAEGNVVWRRTHWEYVDDMHNALYNDDAYWYNEKTLKELNRLWKKYAPHPDVNLWTELVGSPWDIEKLET